MAKTLEICIICSLYKLFDYIIQSTVKKKTVSKDSLEKNILKTTWVTNKISLINLSFVASPSVANV